MEFTSYSYKGAHYRFAAQAKDMVIHHIQEQRQVLEDYGAVHPEFLTSLVPLPCDDSAPPIVKTMTWASQLCDVGPMAAVAGAIAESAAACSRHAGDTSVIIENGGDIFLDHQKPVFVGLFSGLSKKWNSLALRVNPVLMPVSICSSSGTMGHSLSFGRADLATVMSKSGALADAAATRAGNMIQSKNDIEPALEKLLTIPGIMGALIICDNYIGLKGQALDLVKHHDAGLISKISMDEHSDLAKKIQKQ